MKIALITSSRADYGLLKPLIKRLDSDKFFDLKIIATGTHLSKEFGNTYKEIENDGFQICKKMKILEGTDSAAGITKTCSVAIENFGKTFQTIKPDALLVLGDRYEILCGVFAALFFKIPVIHYSGGEKTEGAYDDAIRHAITKMSHLHFVSCEEYRKRVIQLGEDPKTAFNTGSLGVDNIANQKLLSKTEFEKSINLKLNKKTLLVSWYPETLSSLSAHDQFSEVLKSLNKFKDHTIIFTKSNADTDGRIVSKMMDTYAKKNRNARVFESLGMLRYLSAIKYADVVVGNSSSGITEAPSFNKATVNIGHRQKGRIMAKSVINCSTNANEITKAIKLAESAKFISQLKDHKSPFGNGTASKQIVDLIKKFNFKNCINKSFYDLKF